MIVIVLCLVIACSGGVCVGYVMGRVHERERAALRRPQAPHEALTDLAQMPTPAEILAVVRGPLPSRPDPSLTERVGKGPA